MKAQRLLLSKLYRAGTIMALRASGYSKFGHKLVPRPRTQVIWELMVCGGLCLSTYYYLKNFGVASPKLEVPPNLRMVPRESENSDQVEGEDLNDGFVGFDAALIEPIEENELTLTFKEKKINAYENRIRRFSNPDKVFRYFATIKTTKDCSLPNTILMTPSDFLRAIMWDRPQPAGLDLDHFRRLNPDVESWTEADKTPITLPQSSIFKKIPPWDGLLTYNDFLQLLVLISVPQNHLKYVFRMVDADDSGQIDENEFNEILISLIGNARGPSNLRDAFFGHDSRKRMGLGSFLEFSRTLRDELCWIEFHQASNGASTVDAWQFCRCVLSYVPNVELRQQVYRRARSRLPVEDAEITFDEYLSFVHFVERIPDVVGFTVVYKFGLDVATLRALAKNAFGIQLSDNVLRVIFAMFDEDANGKLNQEEFFSVLRAAQTRGARARSKLVYRNGYERLVGICRACILCAVEMLVDGASRSGKALYGYVSGRPAPADKA